MSTTLKELKKMFKILPAEEFIQYFEDNIDELIYLEKEDLLNSYDAGTVNFSTNSEEYYKKIHI